MSAIDPALVLRDLGRRIAELREGRTMTQEVLAERAEVTTKYLQRIEAGSENLTVRSLVKLASLLDTTVGDLFASPVSRAARVGRPRRRKAREGSAS